LVGTVAVEGGGERPPGLAVGAAGVLAGGRVDGNLGPLSIAPGGPPRDPLVPLPQLGRDAGYVDRQGTGLVGGGLDLGLADARGGHRWDLLPSPLTGPRTASQAARLGHPAWTQLRSSATDHNVLPGAFQAGAGTRPAARSLHHDA